MPKTKKSAEEENEMFAQEQKFDELKAETQKSSQIEYGIVHGNNTIVFIKVGLNGTIFGYKNKYLKIARDLNKKHNATVIVSSNPIELGYETDFSQEMDFVKNYADFRGFQDYKIYFMGHSNGATLGILNAYKFPEIKKLLCINGPLNLMPSLLASAFKQFQGEKINLVYGSKDPSFGMAELYRKEFESERIEFSCIKGGEHNFSGCIELFAALPGFFFFAEPIKNKNRKTKTAE